MTEIPLPPPMPVVAEPVPAPEPVPLPVQIAELGSVVAAGVVSKPPAEPGWTTSEFWVTTVTMLFGLLVAGGIIHLNEGVVNTIMGLIATIVPAIFYTIGRSIRKAGTV